MKKKKILFTYASFGAGHKTVANYLYEYFEKQKEYEVKIIDIMDYENLIGLISKKAFEQNFKHSSNSTIFSLIYEIFDFKATTIAYKTITKSILKNKKLRDDIVSFDPDLLISTHFFGNIVLGILNKKKLTNTKIISIITDYKSHEMWLKDEKNIDAFIVCNDIVKKELINKGIDNDKIYPYGLPISTSFKETISKETIRNKYSINNNKKTILFFAGGSIGASFSYKYLKKLLEKRFDINIIYVCGKNEKLKAKAEKLINNNDYKNVCILGYSNEVNNLLNISDIVITKPGAISITECLEMKKPMLLIPGNGGQENYNARFEFKNGYGINCKSPKKLVKNVNKILKRKSIYIKMKWKLNKNSLNKSVEQIYKLSKKILK